MLETQPDSSMTSGATARPTKVTRLIDYLKAVVGLNSKIFRTIDEYERVFWLDDIPRDPKYCFSQTWGEETEHSDDLWIEIQKCREPAIPEVPQNCLEWVDTRQLKIVDQKPVLKESIVVEKIETDPETNETIISSRTAHLKDNPEVSLSWESYIEQKWMPWTVAYKRFSAVQKVYTTLFLLYQDQQKRGEQCELVLCQGLLRWKTPSGQKTKRHIIASRATIEFEPNIGRIAVRPAANGESINLELDMLDVTEQPSNASSLIETGRNAIKANPWDVSTVNPVLNSFANSLSEKGQGEYYADRMRPTEMEETEKPIVEYAPALVFRKRSAKSLETFLEGMKTRIKAGEVIPDEFLDLCESLGEKSEYSENHNEDRKYSFESVYFPLPSNKEQKEIIYTLGRQKGVLVQGPPGTGKSHTISNLICHLLATGQRILVTAKTTRALQVLHNKLPPEIRPLCINLLGQGTEERESLEKSVSGILTRQNLWRQAVSEEKISSLETSIQSDRARLAETEQKLLALREKETFEHSIANGKYTGTAGKIARALQSDAPMFSWLTDKIDKTQSQPLSSEEISYLCEKLLEFRREDEASYNLTFPDLTPSQYFEENIRSLLVFEEKTKAFSRNGADHIHEGHAALLQKDREQIEGLLLSLSDYAVSVDAVRKRPMQWLQKAIFDVLTDRDTPWKELFRLSMDTTKDLHEPAREADKISVSLPSNFDPKKAIHDAETLINYFEGGGKVSVLGYKPKTIRDNFYLVKDVTVDGLSCSNPVQLKKLLTYLTVSQRLHYVWSLWSGKVDPHVGPFPLQLAEIDELHEALEATISLYQKRNDAIEAVNQIQGLIHPKWEDSGSVQRLIADAQTAILLIKIQHNNLYIEAIRNDLLRQSEMTNAHPICKEILHAFEDRDADRYVQIMAEVVSLREKANLLAKKRQIIGKIAEKAPILAGSLANCSDPELWSERLGKIEEAWAWCQAKTWLNDFMAADIYSLERHLKSLEQSVHKSIAELAAMKAWKFCFSRMKDVHRRHLMAWQQAMRKLGKGTGKWADTHRRAAQQSLDQCREAIPAWIMPLHRVYETVQPDAGLFDVIIIDEASQCGPEALPLLFIGKKVLVIGDDKQISPEAVGVDGQDIQQLKGQYLYDFTFADSFDIQGSLFDHAKIRFASRITLREHFRCMPEIIRFSNDLCYRAEPLIPLRQYPPDRLSPIRHVEVSTGYREGSGARIINPPEADALVDEVVRCCQDPKYEGMTMGVIVLQGEAQAYHIEAKLLKLIGAEEMESRRIICGNPYSFQGDERDVIFLSMVAAPNERIGAMTKPADQRRFNVAASRAMEQMWLFHSANLNHLSQQCLRYQLLEFFMNPQSSLVDFLGETAEILREKAFKSNRGIEAPPDPYDSWFEVDVALQIAGRGYRVRPQFEFAGKRIDLVIQGDQQQLAVECDGDHWHGAEAYAADMERQRMLERCGWRFFRVRESRYYANNDAALLPLWTLLNDLGILSKYENRGCLQTANSCCDSEIEDEDEEELQEINEQGNFDHIEDEDVEIESEDVFEGRRIEDSGSTSSEVPQDVYEAIKLKPEAIRMAIFNALKVRPNCSAIKSNVPTYILREWGVSTRGRPRHMFEKRVDQQIAVLTRKGLILMYKSKNIRIKLAPDVLPNMFD